jgi:hypothetical protein
VKFEITHHPDGSVGFKSLDPPGVEQVSASELTKRLRADGVGESLEPSLAAVRGIVGRLLEQSELPDDVKHTLALIDQSSKNALIANLVQGDKAVLASEYRRQILSMQLMLAGDVPIDKRGIYVTDGIFQNVVIRLLEARQADFAAAQLEQRAAIVEEVAKQIFLLVGRTPDNALTEEALEVTGLTGRPTGSRNGGLPQRGKFEIYNDLLREIGFHAASAEALKKQRKRGNKRGDT